MGLTQFITDHQGVNIYTNMRFLAFISWCKSLIEKKRTEEEKPLLPSPPSSPPSEPKKIRIHLYAEDDNAQERMSNP